MRVWGKSAGKGFEDIFVPSGTGKSFILLSRAREKLQLHFARAGKFKKNEKIMFDLSKLRSALKILQKNWISKRTIFFDFEINYISLYSAIKILQKSGDPNNKHRGVD